MAHLLALSLARALALAVGFGSFALYMAAFFFPEVHRKHDLTWSGVGLLYAVVLWFCAGQLEGALLLGQIAGVGLLGWLGWQVLTLRRIKTPIQQQTLPGASSQQIKQVALDQTKAAADNFSLAETATAIAGVTSSAIAAARGQSKPPSRSTAQACPIDTSTAKPSQTVKPSQPQTTVEQPAVKQVRSQPPERKPVTPVAESNETPSGSPTEPQQTRQDASGQDARTSQPLQPVNKVTDEEILQPIVSPPVEATTSATSQASPIAEPDAAADEEWGNWMEDEDFGDSTAETVTVASVQADTVAQVSQSTVDRSAFDPAQASAPVSQPAAPSQNKSKSKLGGITDWIGGLLPFGNKKKSQPMVTLPLRESSLPRSQNATTPKSSQPMLTIPRRESSLRRPSPSTPDTATAAPSTGDQAVQETAIAPDASQAPTLNDDETNLEVNPEAVTDTSTTQMPQPGPEEILIPEPLPSDEEAWGRFSAIATQEDETLTEAVLIEDAATTDELVSEASEVTEDVEESEESSSDQPDHSLATDELESSPAEPVTSGTTVDIEVEADDPENEDHADESMIESTEFVAEADGDHGAESEDQPDDQADADNERDPAADAETEATEAQSTDDHDTDHPALKRPNPPSPELLNDLQRQHYTDYGRE